MRYPNTYAVYDLETTGLYPLQGDEAVEIGLLVVRDGKPEPIKTWLIKTDKPLSNDTVRITGITQQEVDADGRPPAECWREFLTAAKGMPLVGHNIARFDNVFLVSCALRHLAKPEEHESAIALVKYFVDTAALVKAQKLNEVPLFYENHMMFADRVLSIKAFGVKYKLIEAYQALGGPEGLVAHRVAGDIAMTNFVYRRLCGLPVPEAQQTPLL